ncbi:MAG: hypothetical protein ACRC92_20235 [Peptostreptococcaceae bacterium]
MKEKETSRSKVDEALERILSEVLQGKYFESPENITNLDDTLMEYSGVKLFKIESEVSPIEIMNASIKYHNTTNGTYYEGHPGVMYRPGEYYSIASVMNRNGKPTCIALPQILSALIDNKIIIPDYTNVPSGDLIDRSELLKKIVFSSAYSNYHVLVTTEALDDNDKLELAIDDLNMIMNNEYGILVRDFFITEIFRSPYRITGSVKIGMFHLYAFKTKSGRNGDIIPNEHIKIRKFLKGGKK